MDLEGVLNILAIINEAGSVFCSCKEISASLYLPHTQMCGSHSTHSLHFCCSSPAWAPPVAFWRVDDSFPFPYFQSFNTSSHVYVSAILTPPRPPILSPLMIPPSISLLASMLCPRVFSLLSPLFYWNCSSSGPWMAPVDLSMCASLGVCFLGLHDVAVLVPLQTLVPQSPSPCTALSHPFLHVGAPKNLIVGLLLFSL